MAVRGIDVFVWASWKVWVWESQRWKVAARKVIEGLENGGRTWNSCCGL